MDGLRINHLAVSGYQMNVRKLLKIKQVVMTSDLYNLSNYDRNDTLVHNNIADGTDRPTSIYIKE